MAYRLPPLSTLRTFEAAARHLSFKVAAKELNVTPSAVSQQIKSLESYLGVSLFQRLPNTLQLTEDGLSMIQNIRDGLDCFAAGVERTQHGKHFSLNITTPPAFATRWLVPHLSHFSAMHPDVTVRITSNPDTIDGSENAFWLKKNEDDPRQETAELIIRFGTGLYPDYRVEKLLVPDYVLVCSSRLAEGVPPLRRLEDLNNHVLLHDESIPVFEKRPSWHEWLKIAGLKGIDTGRGPRFSNAVLVHEAVLEGQGVALVIKQHVESEVAAGRLVIPFSITLPSAYAYYLLTPEAAARKELVQAFSEWIRAEINPVPSLCPEETLRNHDHSEVYQH